MGRAKDRREVTKLLSSPYPVVTIVGEGGVGKTALAIRCLYDIIEKSESTEFDALIWISLKSQTLTANGVKAVSYTHLRAHETVLDLVCRLLLEKKKEQKKKKKKYTITNKLEQSLY